jgi:glycosyltransferase involved in cell wall biosynthesis
VNERIAITANSSWYLYNFRSALIRELRSRGYHIIAMAPEDRYSPRIPADEFIPLNLRAASLNPLRELASLLHFRRMLRNSAPALILSFGPKINIYAGLIAGAIPQISNISGVGIIKARGALLRQVFFSLYRFAFRHMAFTFFQNLEDQESFVRQGIVKPGEHERIMGSGVDLRRFTAQPLAADAPLRIAYVGRLLASKGIAALIDAFRRVLSDIPDAELHVYGSADPEKRDSIDINDYRDIPSLHFHGHCDDIIGALYDKQLVALPSFYGEGVPRSLIEALALGKIILTSDHAGCRDTVIHGKNGRLVPPGDSETVTVALAQAIRKIHRDRSDWREMSRRSRRLAEEVFDENEILRRYNSRIEEILNAPTNTL